MDGGGLWGAPPLWLLVVDTVYYWLYEQVRPSYPLLALCPPPSPCLAWAAYGYSLTPFDKVVHA